ncbi:MAG: DNA adenine methylase [Ruminococcaceae bacterium]|nr:DNA adenine methylase [Oscillospiraceae bacterium]
MSKNTLVAPIVKWVGGKRQLLNDITPLLPKRISSYCEPFLGGGAVLFSIQPKKAIVNDINKDLINVYEVVRDSVDELIKLLEKHENSSDYFYKLRDIDRNKEAYQNLSRVEKASRILYLNKTCYNGLFRVNSSGEFNAPFGHYKNPNIINAPVLKAVSKYLNSNEIKFYSKDFESILENVKKGCFVYLDPPYDPISDTANFTGYDKGGFNRNEQIRLKKCCDDLTKRNVKFMLSNSATDFIKELYQDYNISIVKANRSVNSNGLKRGAVEEVIVTNYGIE